MGELKPFEERVQKTVSQFLYQTEHKNLVFSCYGINFIITTSFSCFRREINVRKKHESGDQREKETRITLL
jgi:hypothetical protein